jgi:4-alpha-glucanotransferase
LRDPPAGCVASLNTHDLFPFQGFLDEVDIDERVRLGFITTSEATRERKYRRRVRELLEKTFGKDIFAGCSRFLMNSRASAVLYNMEDFWGETKAQNIPSTTREHANWRRRMRYSMERLRELKINLSRDDNRAKKF